MTTSLLQFRVNDQETFELPSVEGETVAQLKTRAREKAGPHECYYALYAADGRPLKLVEPVAPHASFEIKWKTCSHGAPAHPITGESACFWDGAQPTDVEY
jgi:hypothetical protein